MHFYGLIASLGGSAIFYALNRRAQRVVSYHNVLPDELLTGRSASEPEITISGSRFDFQLGEIFKTLKPSLRIGEEASAVITFDDGHRNNASVAAPILEKHGALAYFFVPLAVARSGQPNWLDQLFVWTEFAPVGEYQIGPLRVAMSDEASRVRARVELVGKAAADRCFRRVLLESIGMPTLQSAQDEKYSSARCAVMSKSDLSSLRATGHKIGAHSVDHDRLSSLDADELWADFKESHGAIGDIYNTDVFCYPFGGNHDVNSSVTCACAVAGFSAAFLNTSELPDHLTSGRFAIPRITLSQTDPTWLIHAKLSGLDAFLRRLLLALGVIKSTARVA